ncbi:hypothetical protein NEMBOFW57_007689 [Staphylotrichum longicolle]|uniref:Peptidase M20 domain-containing protein 2 n=1 Tax=Staphylotrichum longicolle TaxID=669026 RepID=A0AAD4EV79_9PEZI|nr:hypothetical protein NEMBOFW57_007689 [Staphylotrichum longicolle]
MKASILSAVAVLTGHVVAKPGPPPPSLASRLQNISASIFPDLKAISLDIWNHPELGGNEHHAHDLVVNYFSNQRKGEWKVTPHAHGMETSWPGASRYSCGKPLPAIGFMAEYDALPEVGHACGHNQITLVGTAAASMVRRALIELDLPGRVVVVGTPDEEGGGGKLNLVEAGAFDGIDIWMMAHPSATDVISPFKSVTDIKAQFRRDTHNEVIREAYSAMLAVKDLVAANGLPGTASTASGVVNVGVFAANVAQGHIALGISGTTLEKVQETVASSLDDTYHGVSFTAVPDASVAGGVNLTVLGPGGHGSEGDNNPLTLTIETFRALNADAQGENLAFYLPGNTTSSGLDVTFDIRTRYTVELSSVVEAVKAAIGSVSKAVILTGGHEGPLSDSTTSHDHTPSLEVTSYLPDAFLEVTKQAELYGENNDWIVSDKAPASTDASFVQGAVVDPKTYELVSAARAVFHPSYNICPPEMASCPFNHEPAFRELAGAEFGLGQAEIMSRALAELAVKLLEGKKMMKDAVAIVGKKKHD